ncbi:hypothetical protein IWQ57_003340 [Coemansia nantahalensis]|uniref:Uncharacterized protein n=1 Tax=Coemansia nantahalensis TaxID=2789366 RepID=A0ACC1JX84_9FUNG|nr:hypothetical protein IWQ57_003340 [Coemansia nantahalensis]
MAVSTIATVGDLPEEVLLLVLRFAAGAPARGLRAWKASFPLLGVCRRWRQLAQQLVFRVAHIECRRVRRRGAGTRVLLTNLGLVACHVDSVRQLVLSAVAGPQLVEQIGSMLSELRQHPGLCAKIRSLTIRGSAAAATAGLLEGQAAPAVESEGFAAVAAALTAAAPNVTQVRIGAGADARVSGAIGGLLVDAYACQLRHIECPAPVALAQPGLSATLTHLSITLGAGPASRLPRVCAASLQVLRLDGVPPGFSWASAFGDSDTRSAAVCFSSLVELCLCYGTARGRSVCAPRTKATAADDVTLRFPQLRRCKIDGCQPHGGPFAAVQLPPTVDCLSFAVRAETALALSRAGVERVGTVRVRVSLEDGRDSMGAFCSATNYWFGRVAVRCEAALELHLHRATLDARQIEWPRMTQLSIHGPCALDAVARIAQRAEALRRLEVYELSVGSLVDDAATPGPDDVPLPELRTSIETLTLHSAADEPCSPQVTGAIRCLLLRLRLLTRANLSTSFGVHASDLRRWFGQQYPHVEAMTIKTY